MRSRLDHVVIAGGGTAGWMAAAALGKALANSGTRVTLVESDEIGTIGVGEATIPAIHYFNATLGIDQAEFLRACNGTFKLGIEFVDWGEIGRRYIHPFSGFGRDLGNVFFHQLFLRYAGLMADRGQVVSIEDYNLACTAARRGRFTHPVGGQRTEVPPLNYAFHFDASLYARFLRGFSEKHGVRRIEGKIAEVRQNGESGHISALQLTDGRVVEGDFFLDCTGQRALLIGRTLGSGYEGWGQWLPCDRAIAAPSPSVEPAIPYTRSIADSAGWRWRIPLQQRVGNGYVYSSAFLDDDAAERRLLETLDDNALAAPRRIPFSTGRRKSFWIGNCVAIGLASGFLEPLESTSIHLIQTAVLKLLALFPDKGMEAADIAAFNRHTIAEYERIRDFLILHYKLTSRDDTPFWRHCRDMEVPDGVRQAMDLFASRGRFLVTADHLFPGPSWLSVMLGQGLWPRGYDPLADNVPQPELEAHMASLRAYVDRTADAMPPQIDYVRNFCGSAPVAD
jgi:tryptophan halogenase